MNQVVNLMEKFSVDLRKENWIIAEGQQQQVITRKDYIKAYMKLLSK